MNLEKRNGESDILHHKRLVYGKLEDRTLSDVSYSELSKYLYGKRYSDDVARRMTYGSYKTLKALGQQIYNTPSKEDIASELAIQTRELQKERQRFFDQRREYNKLIAEEGRREHLEAALVVAANNLESSLGNVFAPAAAYDSECNSSENEAVLVLSDWHYGMKTDNVFNHYDTETCISRVSHIISEAQRRIQLHGCRRLHIIVLGDLIHGSIHVSARVASEEFVADQIMQVSEILAQAVENLSQFVDETCVYITYGNHARTVQNKKESIHRDNMERIIPWWLSQRLKSHEDIIVMTEGENEFMLIESCGHNFVAVHGDLDQVRTSPRLLATLFQKRYGVDVEYVLLGDKHHRESFDELGVCAMICGSLCGTDDYAHSKRLYTAPEQMLLIVNEACGVDAEYRIKC